MQSFAFDRRRLLAGAGLVLAGTARPAIAVAQGGDGRRIGVIGSGHIGGGVGTALARAGHPVMFSSRKPETLGELVAAAGPNARAGLPMEAAAFGDVVLIAVPFPALPQVGRDLAAALGGKPVLVASNARAPRDGDIGEEVKREGVGATTLKYLPGQHVVRAFWAVNFKVVLDEPAHAGEKLGLPIAGEDPVALPVAVALARELNFDPVLLPLARAGEVGPDSPLGIKPRTAAEYRQALGLKSQKPI